MSEIKSIDDVCIETEGFATKLLGNTYCSLALNKKIECPYQDSKKDHNGFYKCINLLYNDDYLGDIQ